MSLSDAKVRNSKPNGKPYKLTDGEGLYLLVPPTGKKYWRFKYRYAGKEKVLAFGTYPEMSLLDARDCRAIARRQLAAGNDPSVIKSQIKKQKIAETLDSFEVIAREWLAKKAKKWKPITLKVHTDRLEMYAFPRLGSRPIGQLESLEVLEMLRVMEQKGIFDTASRVRQDCNFIFRHAIVTARAVRNPVPDLQGALETPVEKHHPFLKVEELPEFYAALETFDCQILTKLAIYLIILTFVRTTELRAAKWKEFNFDKAQWEIPPERMKMKRPHIVPLAGQAIAILRKIQLISGNREFVFPSQINADDCMSLGTMLVAVYRMGFKKRATIHGFRSTASTALNEHGFTPDAIERQLAHCEYNPVRAAYNYAEYLLVRRDMMQWWADHLDEVVKGKTAETSLLNGAMQAPLQELQVP